MWWELALCVVAFLRGAWLLLAGFVWCRGWFCAARAFGVWLATGWSVADCGFCLRVWCCDLVCSAVRSLAAVFSFVRGWYNIGLVVFWVRG